MLQGDLSKVQEECVKLLLLREDQQRATDRFDQIRAAIVSSDPTRTPFLYPEFFTPEAQATMAADEAAQTDEEVEEALGSSDPIFYESVSTAEAQDILALLGEDPMSMTADDLFGDED